MVFIGALTGCSPKKNTAASRNYQAFITRYNIYFNGDEHYKKTLKAMEEKYEDDYSVLNLPSSCRGNRPGECASAYR